MKKWKLITFAFVLACLFGMSANAAGVAEDHYLVGDGDIYSASVNGTAGDLKITASYSIDVAAPPLADDADMFLLTLHHDFNGESGDITTDTPIEVTFSAPAIQSDSIVEVYPYMDGFWNASQPIISVQDGYVTTSFSRFTGSMPVVICVLQNSGDAGTGDGGTAEIVSEPPKAVELADGTTKNLQFFIETEVTGPDIAVEPALGPDSEIYVLNIGKYEESVGIISDTLSFAEPVHLTFHVPAVTESTTRAQVKVYHFDPVANSWDDTPEVVKVSQGQVEAAFTELSPIAIEVNNSAGGSAGSGSGRSGGSGSNAGSGSEPERFTTALSPAAEVTLAGGAADLQIGPPTRTFYESDGQALLGTTGPVNVYLGDFWLVDRATGAVVTPGAEGALVTINIPGVTSSSKVMIRQWPYGTDEYVDFAPVEVGDGYIKVKFTTMSQAAICVANTDAPASSGTVPAASSEKTSPKTSDNGLVYAAEAVALLSVLGFAVCKRRYVK